MKKLYAFTFVLALSFIMAAGTAQAQDNGSGTGMGQGIGAGEATGGASVGQPIGDFTLSDVTGTKHSLASLKGENATIIIFVSTQCPVSNAYNERMEKLSQDYKARGVSLIGINANAPESVDDIKQHAARHHLTFTILKDRGNKVADQLGATNTPEAFLLDASGKLVYRGRIDDSRSGKTISSNDLRDAIEATLNGRPIAKSFVRAFGCTIKRG
jgi:peroxiredoxin